MPNQGFSSFEYDLLLSMYHEIILLVMTSCQIDQPSTSMYLHLYLRSRVLPDLEFLPEVLQERLAISTLP